MSEAEESKGVMVRSITGKLMSGAAVSVGYPTERPDDDSYYFTFTAVDGEETRLRLSKSAFETVIGLKAKVDVARNVASEMKWVLVADVVQAKVETVT